MKWKILREANIMIRRFSYVFIGYGAGANDAVMAIASIIVLIMTITVPEFIPEQTQEVRQLVRVLMGWNDFLTKMLLEPETDVDCPGILNDWMAKIAELPKGEYYEHAPEYGERAWRIPGRKYCIIVWDAGNQWHDPMGVEIKVETFKFITREEEVKICHSKSS